MPYMARIEKIVAIIDDLNKLNVVLSFIIIKLENVEKYLIKNTLIKIENIK